MFRSRLTYVISADIPEEETDDIWVAEHTAAIVVTMQNNNISGFCCIKPPQSASGDHICSYGYIVTEHAREQGIADP